MSDSGPYQRFLTRPIASLMVCLGVLFLGTIAASRLPVALLPDLSYPRLSVYTTAPGRSADEIERSIIIPQEALLSGMAQLQRIEAVAAEGYGLVSLQFTRLGDVDSAMLRLRERLSAFTPPAGVSDPAVYHQDPNARPIAIVTAKSDEHSVSELTDLARDVLVRRLAQIEGVGRVTIEGDAEDFRTFVADPRLLAENELPISRVRDALAAGAERIGTVREGRNSYALRLVPHGSRNEAEMVIPGTRLRLGDVGTFERTTRMNGLVSYNGEHAISLIIEKQYGANTVGVVGEVEAAIAEMSQLSGADATTRLTLSLAFDEAGFIEEAMSSVLSALLIGGGLTVVVLVLSLGSLRQGIAVGLSVPFSVAASALLFYIQGMSVNIMSLGGLGLGIGMMVDNGIVVSEAVHRRLATDADRIRAVHDGVAEVASPIVASTFTSCAVFLPIVFLGGPSALLFRDLALAVTYSLLTSLIVSLTLLPVLLGQLGSYGALGPIAGRVWSCMLVGFRRVLAFADRRASLVLGLSVLAFGLAVWVGFNLPRELLPPSGQERIEVQVRADAGTPTEALFTRMQQLVEQLPPNLVSRSLITAGLLRDARTGLSLPAMSEGRMRLALRPGADAHDAARVVHDALRQAADSLSVDLAVLAEANPLEEVLTEGGSAVGALLLGPSEPSFDQLAKDAIERLSRDLQQEPSRVRGLGLRPAYSIRLRLDVLQAEELSAEAVLAATAAIFDVAEVDRPEGTMLVRHAGSRSFFDAMNTPVLISGRDIVLGHVLEALPEAAPSRIYRTNRRRSVHIEFVSADPRDNQELAAHVAQVTADLDGRLPNGYALHPSGSQAQARQSLSGLGWTFLIAMVLVYMIMAAQFESLLLPLLVMLSVPMALTGIVALFLLTGTSLNLMSAIGATVALGIVINDAIILMTAEREIRDGHKKIGRSPHGSPALLAAERRMRPIIVTSITTVAGMLPLALAGQAADRLRAPLALGVIGGLVTATFLTLVVLPIVLKRLSGERA